MWCKIFVFIVGLVMNFSAQSQGTAFEWVKAMSGGDNRPASIALDAAGNVYTIGVFEGTTDFDPGVGVFNLTSIGVDNDIVITKMDALGNFIWAKAIGGLVDDYAAFAVDAAGNIYMTGYFVGTIDFDPNIGTFNLTPNGAGDIFVCKLNTFGDFVWAKKMGGAADDEGVAIAVDLFGSIYITGYFVGTVDFDPNIGTFNLTSNGGDELFICKLDGSGSLAWAKSIGGLYNDWQCTMTLDLAGNTYIVGYADSTIDLDPDVGVVNLNVIGGGDIFICKLDASGSFVWAKCIGGIGSDYFLSIKVDILGNVYTTGFFEGTADFDPGIGVTNLTAITSHDVFIHKLDAAGNFVWAKNIAGKNPSFINGGALAVDEIGNVYITDNFNGTIDFDPNAGVANRTSVSGYDIYINKLDALGNFVWVQQITCNPYAQDYSINVDSVGNIYTTGVFIGTGDFNPDSGITNISSSGDNTFILKLRQQGVYGRVYQDFNLNCQINVTETGVQNQLLTINPGNIIIRTNSEGLFFIDSLPVGNYTITADTSSPNWQITCPVTQNFTVTNTSTTTIVPSFGFISTNPCPAPDITIHAPFLRPGFSNQKVYIQACNDYLGTDFINNGYVIVELDSLLTVQTSSMPYTNLGNNQYQINIDTLYPGQCTNFWLGCTLSTNAILGQTLCMNAKLYPVDSCALDVVPSPQPSTPLGEVTPCTLPWDRSSLRIDAACVNNDSVRFIIYNTGLGMNCFAPVRIYLDGQLIQLDSIQLAGGDSTIFMFAGNGQTWRLEADQHPLHPGNSQPNATIENCGTGSWTPNLVNILPMDDADPIIDIYCGLVTGSYDPNDKTGYPLGVGSNHDILPFQDMEYVIRFQNTGTDTAFTIVVRDTLSTDFNIFSVRSGVSSHDYSFKMYGPRVLEWTFNNIMLPDSNVNEPASHGFVKFKVHHAAGLTNGTVTENSAAIYFDFNPPIFTNTSWHTINDYLNIGNAVSTIATVQNSTKVYPNPTNGRITLQIEQRFNTANIQVMNTLGQVVLTSRTSDAVSDLTLPNAAGIYFIRVEIDGVVQTHKVVRE